jgi:hypothetical protein
LEKQILDTVVQAGSGKKQKKIKKVFQSIDVPLFSVFGCVFFRFFEKISSLGYMADHIFPISR